MRDFCTAPDLRQLVAVLGVFSAENRVALRREARVSWMRVATTDISARFVMRGVGAGREVIREAAHHRDVRALPLLHPAPHSP